MVRPQLRLRHDGRPRTNRGQSHPNRIFLPEEYKTIIDATYAYSDRPSIDKHNSITVGGYRIRALTEVMRWTGLRIRDAVTLEKHAWYATPNPACGR